MSVKALKDAVINAFKRQESGVGQGKLNEITKHFGIEFDLPLRRRVLDGVADQIVEQLLKQAGIGQKFDVGTE